MNIYYIIYILYTIGVVRGVIHCVLTVLLIKIETSLWDQSHSEAVYTLWLIGHYCNFFALFSQIFGLTQLQLIELTLTINARRFARLIPWNTRFRSRSCSASFWSEGFLAFSPLMDLSRSVSSIFIRNRSSRYICNKMILFGRIVRLRSRSKYKLLAKPFRGVDWLLQNRIGDSFAGY